MSRYHTNEWDFPPEQAFRPAPFKRHPATLEGGKGSSAPPPDPALVKAQIHSMDVQNAGIEQYQQMLAQMAPLQQEQLRQSIDQGNVAYQQSQDDRQYALGRRGILTGLQDQAVADAAGFNSGLRGDQLAAQASADAQTAFDTQRGVGLRNMERMGVNPASGAMAAMTTQNDIGAAKAQASAVNQVRQAARLEGYQLSDRASNLLAGYPGMGMQATGAGAQYGTMGLGLANQGIAGVGSGFSTLGSMAGGLGSNATGMYGAQSNYKTQQDQIAAENDPTKTILGAAAGAAMTVATGGIGAGLAAAAASAAAKRSGG